MKTLKSELIDKGHLQTRTSEVVEKSIKAKDKPKEQLTDREWRELMGQNRQTHKRVNGAVRRR